MRAILRGARISPKKANLVAAMVRGMTVSDALKELDRLPKKGALLLRKTILSAVANAEHNADQPRDLLRIASIIVNKGPAMRRWIPIARGRSRPIDKWMSHIHVELGIAVPQVGAESEISEGNERARRASDETSATPQKKKEESEPAIEAQYSESKPVDTHHQSEAQSGVPDGHSAAPEGHGGVTFQQQRKGSRGS